jgi:hypothetical protein
MMKLKLNCGWMIALCLATSLSWADSLKLRNGSLINGTFAGGSETEITFRVGTSVQKYNRADIASLNFDSEKNSEPATMITIPAGTLISVRTIDDINSTRDPVGGRFEASLQEALTVDGNVVVPKWTEVYGRLAESRESGTFTGRSQLRLELTGIVVNGQTVPVVTGEYEVTGKSRGANTAKRTVGGAALGSIIGAVAGGGKGAAIGAGAGAAVGAGSEIITRGDQVKVPSETLLDFTLHQDVSIPTRPN